MIYTDAPKEVFFPNCVKAKVNGRPKIKLFKATDCLSIFLSIEDFSFLWSISIIKLTNIVANDRWALITKGNFFSLLIQGHGNKLIPNFKYKMF